MSLRQEIRFRLHGSPGREEEADTRKDERALATQPAGEKTGKRTTDDTADQRTGRSESVHHIGVFEITGTLEECLQTLLGT